MITAVIVADSVSTAGKRITTWQLEYPRYIHEEFLTHRQLSRSSSSSRAIPVAKLIERVERDPVIPVHWGKNQPGMQADEEVDPEIRLQARIAWLDAAQSAVRHAKGLAALGVHKQVVNRLLYPFQHIATVMTATEVDNFFALRYHRAADPVFQALAREMWRVREESEPTHLGAMEWHLPYISDSERNVTRLDRLREISTARCARVSYLRHDGSKTTPEEDLALFDRLMGGEPRHASPTEHQAMALTNPTQCSGNFRGWLQFRKTIEGECAEKFTPPVEAV